jgi:hypothetical protein
MSNLFICASGFTQHEKKEIETLTILLGAKYTAALKPNITTHLICKEPKGLKYETAIKGNIRTVTKQWLEECALRVCFGERVCVYMCVCVCVCVIEYYLMCDSFVRVIKLRNRDFHSFQMFILLMIEKK